jgi:hypothetical protein
VCLWRTGMLRAYHVLLMKYVQCCGYQCSLKLLLTSSLPNILTVKNTKNVLDMIWTSNSDLNCIYDTNSFQNCLLKIQDLRRQSTGHVFSLTEPKPIAIMRLFSLWCIGIWWKHLCQCLSRGLCRLHWSLPSFINSNTFLVTCWTTYMGG